MLIVSSSFMPLLEHFTFQTRWMATQLVACDREGKVYNGRLLSDVTYKCFKNGYLLTTSMYCKELGQWILVQLSWMRGLSEQYYKIHFSTLFKKFKDKLINNEEAQTLCRQVVDFSAAQRNGFILAYMEVFNKADPSQASPLLKGCHEHFRA